MYLNSGFLSWYSEWASFKRPEVGPILRAYEMWRHARDRVKTDATYLDRIDAIGTLRRAVNQRLKMLRIIYNFDCLPSLLAKKQTLERLQEYGIVRSAIIKNLFEVRNLIEHQDSDPPDIGRCRYYLDIVWYFLKSTDKLLDFVGLDLHFQHEDGRQEIELTVDYANDWQVELSGNVESALISKSAIPGTIAVDDFRKKQRRAKGLLWIMGRARPSGEQLGKLARGCFSTLGYWHDDNEPPIPLRDTFNLSRASHPIPMT